MLHWSGHKTAQKEGKAHLLHSERSNRSCDCQRVQQIRQHKQNNDEIKPDRMQQFQLSPYYIQQRMQDVDRCFVIPEIYKSADHNVFQLNISI